jgi:uncharacterized membrane protein
MPRETIVIIFPSRTILLKALDYLNEQADLNIQDAAIVAKAATGEVTILEGNLSADEVGVAGGTLGAAMTALGLMQFGALPGVGPIIALGTGALIGGLIGRATGRFATYLRDVGFKHYQVDALAEELEEGHPALVLELNSDIDVLTRLREELKAYKAELVERLREGWKAAEALGDKHSTAEIKKMRPLD